MEKWRRQVEERRRQEEEKKSEFKGAEEQLERAERLTCCREVTPADQPGNVNTNLLKHTQHGTQHHNCIYSKYGYAI